MKYILTSLVLLLITFSSCVKKPALAQQEADHREAIIYQKGQHTVLHDVGTDELIVLQTDAKLTLEKPIIVIQVSQDLIVLHTGPNKEVQRFEVSDAVIGIASYKSQEIIDKIVRKTKTGSEFIPAATEKTLELR